MNKEPSTVQNHNQSNLNSDKAQVLKANQTSVPTPQTPLLVTNNASSSPSVNKEKTQTQSSGNSKQTAVFPANQTVIAAPVTQVADNKSSSSSTVKVGSSEKIDSGKDEKKVAQKGEASNYTSSLSKKQRNETKPGVSVKQGNDDLIESLKKCDLFDGDWVKDDSYPLYKPGSCSLIDEQFNCIRNGRPDKDYQKFKWKPRHCNLPRYIYIDGV